MFSRSRFFRVQVFQGPGFSGPRFFRVQVFQDPGPGFRSSHVKLVKFHFLDIPTKHWFYLNSSNVFINPAFMVLNCWASEESVGFYLIRVHSSYYVISFKFRRIFQKVEESCFRTSKELFNFTLSFARWVLCRYRIIIILIYLFETK